MVSGGAEEGVRVRVKDKEIVHRRIKIAKVPVVIL